MSQPFLPPILFEDARGPSIPARCLPPLFADFAQAVALSAEVEESIALMGILGVVSTALSSKYIISPKPRWYEPINIYTLIALPPANNKSLILRFVSAPLVMWETEQRKEKEFEIKRQRSEYHTNIKIIERMRTKAANLDKSFEQTKLLKEIADMEAELREPDSLPQLFVNDITPESLSIVCHEQKGRIAIISDEGGVLETLGGLYSNGIANTDIILKGIEGGQVRIRRKDREYMLKPYLTLLLFVQPQILLNMAEKRSFTGNGVLERFLYVVPESQLGYRTHDTLPVSSELIELYNSKIIELLDFAQQITAPQTLLLSEESLQEWKAFQLAIESELRPIGMLGECAGWGGKICGFALRIAGLLHVMEHSQSTSSIAVHTMNNALEIAGLLSKHAVLAFNMMGTDQATEDAKAILAWIQTKNIKGFTKTEIITAMKNRKMGKADRLDKALEVLVSRNMVMSETDPTTRKPTTHYVVNPELYKE